MRKFGAVVTIALAIFAYSQVVESRTSVIGQWMSKQSQCQQKLNLTDDDVSHLAAILYDFGKCPRTYALLQLCEVKAMGWLLHNNSINQQAVINFYKAEQEEYNRLANARPGIVRKCAAIVAAAGHRDQADATAHYIECDLIETTKVSLQEEVNNSPSNYAKQQTAPKKPKYKGSSKSKKQNAPSKQTDAAAKNNKKAATNTESEKTRDKREAAVPCDKKECSCKNDPCTCKHN